jgi:hypothetical protein
MGPYTSIYFESAPVSGCRAQGPACDSACAVYWQSLCARTPNRERIHKNTNKNTNAEFLPLCLVFEHPGLGLEGLCLYLYALAIIHDVLVGYEEGGCPQSDIDGPLGTPREQAPPPLLRKDPVWVSGFSVKGFSVERFSLEGFSVEGFSVEGFSVEGLGFVHRGLGFGVWRLKFWIELIENTSEPLCP